MACQLLLPTSRSRSSAPDSVLLTDDNLLTLMAAGGSAERPLVLAWKLSLGTAVTTVAVAAAVEVAVAMGVGVAVDVGVGVGVRVGVRAGVGGLPPEGSCHW